MMSGKDVDDRINVDRSAIVYVHYCQTWLSLCGHVVSYIRSIKTTKNF